MLAPKPCVGFGHLFFLVSIPWFQFTVLQFITSPATDSNTAIFANNLAYTVIPFGASRSILNKYDIATPTFFAFLCVHVGFLNF